MINILTRVSCHEETSMNILSVNAQDLKVLSQLTEMDHVFQFIFKARFNLF